MSGQDKALFFIDRPGMAHECPVGRLICGTGTFERCAWEPGEEANFFEDFGYHEWVPMIGFAVLEGRLDSQTEPSGEVAVSLRGTWRRLNSDEANRMQRGLLPFVGDTPELDALAKAACARGADGDLEAISRALTELRVGTCEEISPNLAAGFTGLSEDAAIALFDRAVDAGLFERIPVWMHGTDDAQTAEDMSEWGPAQESQRFMILDSEDEPSWEGEENITWCYHGTLKLKRALAERDGESV